VASNLTRVFARVNQDMQVVYGTDIDRATAVVNQVGQELTDDPEWSPRILEAPRVDRVSALGELGVTLKVVGTVRASDQWAVGGELRKRLLAAFQDAGIEIPQPQRVVLAPATVRESASPPATMSPPITTSAPGSDAAAVTSDRDESK
jgi:small conductance mechanosensitive channel